MRDKFLLILILASLIAFFLLFYFEKLNFTNEVLFKNIILIQRVKQKQLQTIGTSKIPPLRIAQVATLEVSVPPKAYGGTERIVSYLTEELVHRGHNVTLFASSDSRTAGKLISTSKLPAFQYHPVLNRLQYYKSMIEEVRRMAQQFDVVHFHIDDFMGKIYEIFKDNKTITLITTHSLINAHFWNEFKDFPLVSISLDQQKHVAKPPNFVGAVYHGIPHNLFKLVEKPKDGGYLAFLGRISTTKLPDWAIQIAVKAKVPLKMAAQVYPDDYWNKRIKPMIEQHKDLVEFVGELNDSAKKEFLGNAFALIFPIDWEEPFGMVMIEAMACGTPVVARRRGSVPEIVEEGLTGFHFKTINEAAQAVHKARQLDRTEIRRTFERRFTVERMADGYEEIYIKMLNKRIQGMEHDNDESDE